MTLREVAAWAHFGLCAYCGSHLHNFALCPDAESNRSYLRRRFGISETKLEALKEDIRRDRMEEE